MRKKSLVAGALILVLMLGANVVFAASVEDSQPFERLHPRVRMGRLFGAERMCESIAQGAGLSREQICAVGHGDGSIEELLKAKGIDAQAFFEDILSERKAQLDELVASGRLSAEEAEQALKNIAERFESGEFPMRARHGQGHGPGRRGGF